MVRKDPPRAKGQLTGMRGVYLVAAELCGRGLIAAPTSRSAIGADILATNLDCSRTVAVQVKTNATTFDYWLLSAKAKQHSPLYVYVFVNLLEKDRRVEFFVVPSHVVAERTKFSVARTRRQSEWHQLYRADVLDFKDNWQLFDERNALADQPLPVTQSAEM
jgi:hypothetical protein